MGRCATLPSTCCSGAAASAAPGRVGCVPGLPVRVADDRGARLAQPGAVRAGDALGGGGVRRHAAGPGGRPQGPRAVGVRPGAGRSPRDVGAGGGGAARRRTPRARAGAVAPGVDAPARLRPDRDPGAGRGGPAAPRVVRRPPGGRARLPRGCARPEAPDGHRPGGQPRRLDVLPGEPACDASPHGVPGPASCCATTC